MISRWISISVGAALVWIAHLAAAEMLSPALLVLNKEDSALAIVDPAAWHGGKEMTE